MRMPAAIDFKGHSRAAFEVLSGGYAQKFDPNHGWVQVNGSRALLAHQAHAAPGSRRARRRQQWKGWERSHVIRDPND